VVNPVSHPDRGRQTTPVRQTNEASFDRVLENQIERGEALKFSAHAQNRLLHRHISLTPQQMDRLQHGVDEANKKGARDSLVMLDHLAFVVNVPNRTVVTAMDNPAQRGAVFTQIDSAIIA
jgi:flagellar operon protein